MFESRGAYIAVVQGLGEFRGRTLADLRSYVIADAERVWSEEQEGRGEVEFSISADLRPMYPLCKVCGGRGKVESDRVGAQYLTGVAGAMDLNLRATDRCPTCEGTGVEVPGFGARV